MCGFCDYKGPDCCHLKTKSERCERLQIMQARNTAEGRPLNFIPQKEIVWPMKKVVIQFPDGTYWRNYSQVTQDINEAWTFNREQGAQQTIDTNRRPGGEPNSLHGECKIFPVLVHKDHTVTLV